MKLTERTLSTLKTFSTINRSLLVRPGNVLATISDTRAVYAQVWTDQEFAKGFAIFDLRNLLQVISLFKDPDVEFGDVKLTIRGGHKKVDYVYAAENVVYTLPEQDLDEKVKKFDVEFDLAQQDLAELMKAASVLGVDRVHIVGSKGKVKMTATDKGIQNHGFSIEVGETDQEFDVVYKLANMQMPPDDYRVAISKKGMSKFYHEVDGQANSKFWIAIEKESSFS